jgi:hypothetical protein
MSFFNMCILSNVRQIRKAMRQVRAARTVALIIGAFFVCYIPYTVVAVMTALTGKEPTYDVNFAVNFMAFASGLVDPTVCLLVNRDFWASFRILVGLRRRELLRSAALAFAEAIASNEPADWGVDGCRRRFMSIESGSSSVDSSDWAVFRERWNELQAAAERRRSSTGLASTSAAASPMESPVVVVENGFQHQALGIGRSKSVAFTDGRLEPLPVDLATVSG